MGAFPTIPPQRPTRLDRCADDPQVHLSLRGGGGGGLGSELYLPFDVTDPDANPEQKEPHMMDTGYGFQFALGHGTLITPNAGANEVGYISCPHTALTEEARVSYRRGGHCRTYSSGRRAQPSSLCFFGGACFRHRGASDHYCSQVNPPEFDQCGGCVDHLQWSLAGRGRREDINNPTNGASVHSCAATAASAICKVAEDPGKKKPYGDYSHYTQ